MTTRPVRSDQTCQGVTATGPCTVGALYAIQRRPGSGRPTTAYGCGMHMPQLVKRSLRAAGDDAVVRLLFDGSVY